MKNYFKGQKPKREKEKEKEKGKKGEKRQSMINNAM